MPDDVKQIEQDRRREPDLAQHVADLRGEKTLGDEPKNRKSIGISTINVAR